MARALFVLGVCLLGVIMPARAHAAVDNDWAIYLRAARSDDPTLHMEYDLLVGTMTGFADAWRSSPDYDAVHNRPITGTAEIGSMVFDGATPPILHDRASADRRAPLDSSHPRKMWDIYTRVYDVVPSSITITGWVFSKLDGTDTVVELWKAEDYGVVGRSPIWTVPHEVTGRADLPNFTSAPMTYSGTDIQLKLVAYIASAAITCAMGDAKSTWANQAVYITDAVVTSTNADYPGLWIESSNRASGLKVDGTWSVVRGDKLEVAGVVSWINGIPVLTNPELKKQNGRQEIAPPLFTNADVASDTTESLNYNGINPVGLLVTCCGQVTKVDTANHVFYIDDGSKLADGMGPTQNPYVGLRVSYKSGITPPVERTHQRITGIRTVENMVLQSNAVVNGTLRHAGETLYVPVLAIRDAADVTPLD